MSASASQTAPEIRPRLQNDVVFLRVDNGVYLRSSENACVVKGNGAYDWLSTLAPLMTGEYTVQELCSGLDEGRRRTVLGLVRTLLDRGFARQTTPPGDNDLPAEVRRAFAPQINLIDHYGGSTQPAAQRFQRFRTSTVLVAGDDEVALAAAGGLLRNGLAALALAGTRDDGVEPLAEDLSRLAAQDTPATVSVLTGEAPDPAGADLVVYAADGTGLAGLMSLTRRLMKQPATATTRLLPIVLTPDTAMLGPVCGPGISPCWVCAQLRATAGDPARTADLWRDLALGAPAGRGGQGGTTVRRMVGNAAAFEGFRLLTGQLGATDTTRVVVQDSQTLAAHRELLLPHPLCPLCADNRPPVLDHLAPAESPEASHERVSLLLGSHVGLAATWADESMDLIPLKSGRLRIRPPWTVSGGDREITGFDIDNLLGARVNAMRAAVESYVGRCGPIGAIRDTARSLAHADRRPVAGHLLDTWSGGLARADDTEALDWLPAVSLTTGREHLVPAAAVHPFSAANADLRFERGRAGIAADTTPPRATYLALVRALGHRALISAVRGASVPVPFDDAVRDEDLAFLYGGFDRFGTPARLVMLPGAEPVHVVLASIDSDDPLWTVGMAGDAAHAAWLAARDLLGLVQTRSYEGRPADLGDPILPNLDPRALLPPRPVPAEPERPAGPEESAGPVEVDTGPLLAAVRAGGGDALLVDVTTRDLRVVQAMTVSVVLLTTGPY